MLKNYYQEKVIYSKLWSYKFKKFISRSVFGELQLKQILNFQTSYCNLKIRGLGAKLCMAFSIFFHFERNYNVLKSNSQYFLLSKNISFNKNEVELKMENPTHSFREMSLYRRTYIDEPISSYKKCELKVKLS